MLTDLVNEFYGTHGARRLTFVGLGSAIFVWLTITVSLHLPDSPDSAIAPEAGSKPKVTTESVGASWTVAPSEGQNPEIPAAARASAAGAPKKSRSCVDCNPHR